MSSDFKISYGLVYTLAMEKVPFCVLPWIHSYVDAESNRALCCIAKPYENAEELNAMSIEQYGVWLEKKRAQMLEGEVPKECSLCAKGEAFEKQREAINENLIDDFQKVAQESNMPLVKTYAPVYLDYRIDNTCNLSCLSCSGFLSSTIAAKAKKAGVPYQNQSGEKEKFEAEYLKLVERNQYGTVYFASGEPFVNKTHWETLRRLEGKEKQFKLFYNSNLTVNKYQGKPIDFYLKKFKRIDISLSLDSSGQIGEMLRIGLDNEKWLNHYQYLSEAGLLDTSKIYCVLSIPALVNLKNFLTFCDEIGREVIFTPVLGNSHEYLLMTSTLDKSTLNAVVDSVGVKNNLPDFTKESTPIKELSKARIKSAIGYYYKLSMAGHREGELLEFYQQHHLLKEWFYELVKHAFLERENVLKFDELVVDFVLDFLVDDITIISCNKFEKNDFETIERVLVKKKDLIIFFLQPSRSFLRKVLIKNSLNARLLKEEVDFFNRTLIELKNKFEVKVIHLPPEKQEFFKKSGFIQFVLFTLIKIIWFVIPQLVSMRESWEIKHKTNSIDQF